MKINHLIVFLLLLAATSCASTRRSTEINPPFVASESTWLYRDAEVVNRRLKPLERPQVRFDVEHAILHGDSVWVVVRATIPHRSIRREEWQPVPDGCRTSISRGVLHGTNACG